ncbi:hypothetical protein Tco_0349290 [Tanacetum coccineum]
MIKKAVKEAKLLEMSKLELIKVVHEEAEKAGIDPKILASAKGGKEFKNNQDAEIKQETEICIPRLECYKSLPEGVPFMNNMVIEEPEYEMFFIDVFGDHAFQRMSDINNFGVETLITYLVMASNITTLENGRFCLKLRKLIANHPDQEKLKSKKVKLESLGYKLD